MRWPLLVAPIVVYTAACAARGAASARWPRVPGVITDITVRRAHGVDGDVLERLDVGYRFSDGIDDHTGSRSYFGDAFLLSFLGRRGSPRYALGQTIQISYNPARPGDSVLRPGVQRELLVLLFAGVLLLILGTVLLVPG